MPIDPYLQWLEIPADRRPPTHYDLLGFQPLEFQAARVEVEASRRIAHVRKYQVGAYSEIAQRVINELSQALACLSDDKRRAAYDRQIGGLQTLADDGSLLETLSDTVRPPDDPVASDTATKQSLEVLSALVQMTEQLPADAPPPASEVALEALPLHPPDRRLRYAAIGGVATVILCLLAVAIGLSSGSTDEVPVEKEPGEIVASRPTTPVVVAVNPPLEKQATTTKPTTPPPAVVPAATPANEAASPPALPAAAPQPAVVAPPPRPAPATAPQPQSGNGLPGGQPPGGVAPQPPAAEEPAVAENAKPKPTIDVTARLRDVQGYLQNDNYVAAQRLMKELDALELNKRDRTLLKTLQGNLVRLTEQTLNQAQGLLKKSTPANRVQANRKLQLVILLDPDGPHGATARELLGMPASGPTIR